MKLATLKDGSRDGKLVVVSRDLTRFTDASFLAPTLQAALDDWRRISPHLETLAQSLEVGAVPSSRFHEHDAHSPLPRAYQHIGCGDAFVGPRDPIISGSGAPHISASVAVVTGDLARHGTRQDARDAIVLVMLAAHAAEKAGDEALSAFSPVAVTPDELGADWDARVGQPVHIVVNGRPSVSAAVEADFAALASAAAKSRPLSAGAILASTVTPAPIPLKVGDTLRIELKDMAGHSVFGAIEQTVVAAG